MNNPIPTTIEAREKLFDEQYSWVLEEEGMHYTESIRGFNHESYNELLRAMVEEIEGLKKEIIRKEGNPLRDLSQTGNVAYYFLATLQDKIKSYLLK